MRARESSFSGSVTRITRITRADTGDSLMPKLNVVPLTGASDELGAKRLRIFVDRIERLEEEKSGIAADIRDIYTEAKGVGYDVKALRKLIALRKIELERRREQEEILHLYMHALGMLEGTPLGDAAAESFVKAGAA